LDRQLARWQAEPNSPLTPEALAALAPFEEIQKLDPARICRIHDLMFPQQEHAQPSPGNGKEPVAQVIRRHLFNVLKIEELDDAAPFQDYGLNSISGMVLFNRLGKELRRDMDPGWLVDYPTVQALAAHLESASELTRK
jgi:acyl carrier protein